MKGLYENYNRTRFKQKPGRDAVWKEVARYLQRFVDEKSSVLDIGAGYCSFINNIHAKKRFALDISPDVKKHASRGVVAMVGRCDDLSSFRDGSFDVVFASNLFEHLQDEELASTLSEIRRVLAKGGRLIVIQPNFKYCYREYFDDYTHKQVFTHVSMNDRLEAAGFEVVKLMPRILPFSMNKPLPIHPLLVRLYLASPFRPFAGQMLVVAMKSKD